MAEMRTQQNDSSVEDFLNSIEDEKRRVDSFAVLELMRTQTGIEPKMWGSSIVGFGEYHYKYASGREGDAPKIGFSPRKGALTLYLTYDFEKHQDLMEQLGKYKTGKACLYIKRLEDVDLDVLKGLIERSYHRAGKE